MSFYAVNSLRAWTSSGLVLLGLVAGHAQLPSPRLDAVFPPGGQAGTTLPVTLKGESLDDLAELKFSAPGFESKPEANGTVSVSISSNVPPGVYEVRFVGRFGNSNPRSYVVGRLPEVNEEGTHHKASQAAALPLDTTLNGRCDANQIDFYKFAAEAGTQLTISCQASSIDSRMESAFFLTDASGQELLRSRTGEARAFRVPVSGEYILGVHDFLFRGGPDYFYRLTVGGQAYILYAFPPVGPAGGKQSVTLFGYNLPGGELAGTEGTDLQKLSVEIELPESVAAIAADPGGPAGAPLDGIFYRLSTPQVSSNPVFIGLAAAPVTLETEPNNQPDLAQAITLPCEWAGRFHPAGDVDWVSFAASKGEVWWIEVISHRLGLPTHPFLLLQHIKDNKPRDIKELYASDSNIGGLEFNTSSRDPSWRFEVNEDGLYRLQIRDLFNHAQDDPTRVYRLSLRREEPDFRLVALPVAMAPRPKDRRLALVPNSVARLGETVPIRVVAFRQDQFSGPIQLRIPDLPAGIHCPEVVIPAGETEAVLLLTAETNAPTWTGAIQVLGAAQHNGNPLERRARFGTVTWSVPDTNNERVQARLMDDLLFSVNAHESAPIDLRAQPSLETSVAGKIKIPLDIARQAGFEETLKIKPYGLKALEKAKEEDLDPKAPSATYELDLSQLKLDPGIYQFYFQTETKGKYRDNPEAAAAAEEASKNAEKQFEEAKRLADEAKQKIEAARKAAQEAEARANELREAAARAENEAEEATAVVAKAEETRKAASERAKAAQEKAKPRDVTIPVYSTPVTLRVTPAPIRLVVEPRYSVVVGEAGGLPVRIERLYGFADPVELSVRFPDDTKGIKTEPATIAKEEAAGRINLSVTAESPPGQHRAVVQAKLKLNGQELKVEQELNIELTSPPEPAAAGDP